MRAALGRWPIRGQITVLIGANGCGKSTLLRTVGGSLPRLAGSVLGAGCGALARVFSDGNMPTTLLLMAVGVMLGRHVENSGAAVAYMGTQFALVFLVVFVPDDYRAVSSTPGWSRFEGIVIGLLLLMLVRGLAAVRWRRA